MKLDEQELDALTCKTTEVILRLLGKGHGADVRGMKEALIGALATMAKVGIGELPADAAAKLTEAVRRRLQAGRSVNGSIDYDLSPELRELSAEAGIPEELWPWKTSFWAGYDRGDIYISVTRGHRRDSETMYYWRDGHWLVTPMRVPDEVRDAIELAVKAGFAVGHLEPNVAGAAPKSEGPGETA